MTNDEMLSSYDLALDLYCNKYILEESELIPQLRVILNDNPNVVHERDEDDWTLLHHAACHRSPEFCQVLVSQNNGLVRTADGSLPFHLACINKNIDTAKYLFGLYPKSISIADDNGFTPLHCFLSYNYGEEESDIIELLQFLLQNDQGAVSTFENDAGKIPLHLATWGLYSDAVVKPIFNAYPEAIYIEDYGENTPLDIAREWRNKQ